jgi:predicted metal-dependent phosphotriesterase family hydrolase
MTVRGPVPAEALGVTLPHEHVFIDLMREYRGDGLLNDEPLMTREVAAFHDAGGGTIVDVTSIGLGRRPEALRRVSQATGVNIVMGSGFYRVPYLDRDAIDRQTVDELADGIVRDLEEGVDGTDVRAGIIGEIACDGWLTAAEERCFRAAARAHRRTGLTITTHAGWWPVGPAQLDLLEEEGVDPARVIIGHCDLVPDQAYHLELARRGAWIQFDCIQGATEYDTTQRLTWIRALLDAGFGDRLLLSHDVCLRSNLATFGGPGYTYVPTTFRERLIESGIPTEVVTSLLVHNPRRALSGA